MKKIQCTGCGQVFWTDLQIDEALVASGEWVQNPCPKCGAKWAVVEPGGVVRARRGRRAKPGPKRGGRPKKELPVKIEEKEATLSGSGIRRLRKKLKLSQKEFGTILGVSASSIISWEKGKFQPRKDKMIQLAGLLTKGKEDVKKLLAEKISSQAGKKAEKAQAGKPKGRGRARQKAAAPPKK